MSMKLYVGNLPFSIGDEDLGAMFSQVGEVSSAKIIMDRNTGRSKGFGFVEMANEACARQAIDQMNGAEIQGRALTVNEARPMVPKFSRGEGNGFEQSKGQAFGNRNERSHRW